ncbi:MAG: hypothetical protein EOO02_14630 [Chitinophagaceae bacterium]|nr:MAG: hypothetical protein EOO02_14630 [Chitinophagaceae bacterium]
MDKHSYIDDKKTDTAEKTKESPETTKDSPAKGVKESGTSKNDQKDLPRTDPGLKKGYNEKNPSQPQGGFTPNSQAEDASEVEEGDESKK